MGTRFHSVAVLPTENPFPAAEELTGCSPMSPCTLLLSAAPTLKPLSTAAHRWRSSGGKSRVLKRVASWGPRRSRPPRPPRPPQRSSLWMVRGWPYPVGFLRVSCWGRSQPTKYLISRGGSNFSEGGQALESSR